MNDIEFIKQFKDSTELSGEYNYYAEELATRLEKALQQIPRWIPVTERLPEDYQEVWAQRRSGVASIMVRRMDRWELANSPDVYCPDKYVVAWQPLPAPFVSDSDSQKEK